MTPAINQHTVALVLYWLIMLPIAAYILHAVASYCTDDAPTTFRQAILIVLVVSTVVFFTYDISGYIFARMMADPTVGINMPPGYGYWQWLQEPIGLKWHVLGLLPIIRYLPLFFAFIAGGIAHVMVWKVEFKLGFVVFIAQIFLTVLAMVILSIVFRFGISYYDHFFPPKAPAADVQKPARNELTAEPANLEELAERCDQKRSRLESIWQIIEARWGSANSHLAPLYNLLQPITNHLPPPAQDFLNAGGWLLVFVGLFLLFILRERIHRNRKQYLRPKVKRKKTRMPPASHIELASVGDSVSNLGPRQATIRGVPARLRLVVMTPDPSASGAKAVPAPVDEFLNSMHGELSELTATDFPRAEVWHDEAAQEQFRHACEKRLGFPKAGGPGPHWVVLVGTTTWHGLPAHVALGFKAKEPPTDRIIHVPTGKWADFLGSRDVPKDERL